jgi:hypothetical protein
MRIADRLADSEGGDGMRYITQKHELKDDNILKDLEKAAAMYEDGEISEVHDMLLEIVGAIEEFEEHYEV